MQGYRKFTACLLSIASCTGLAWAEKIDPGVYATVMAATVGAYLAANVMAKTQGPAVGGIRG